MSCMFQRAKVFNQDISRWETSKVTTMHRMFEDALAFSQDLSGWKVSQVSDQMEFDNRSKLTTKQLPKFKD